MRELQGNIWEFHTFGYWVIVTTNGVIKPNREAVMGKGVALQAKQIFPEFPKALGSWLADGGNHVGVFPEYRLITMPTKHHWRDWSDISLIERSAKEVYATGIHHKFGKVYSVRPGCGFGKLNWENVKEVLSHYWDDRFVIVEKGK